MLMTVRSHWLQLSSWWSRTCEELQNTNMVISPVFLTLLSSAEGKAHRWNRTHFAALHEYRRADQELPLCKQCGLLQSHCWREAAGQLWEEGGEATLSMAPWWGNADCFLCLSPGGCCRGNQTTSGKKEVVGEREGMKTSKKPWFADTTFLVLSQRVQKYSKVIELH